MTTASQSVSLGDNQLSAVYRAADHVAWAGQRATKWLIRTELISLIVASGAGVTTVRVGQGRFDVLALVSVVAFLVAMGATIRRAVSKPERDWYEGRAAAESARTLAWKYAMRADPFTMTDLQGAADRFLERLGQVLDELNDIRLSPPAVADRELTEAMRQVRAADVGTQRLVYRRDRIENQIEWYARRSRDHAQKARLWLSIASGASALGVVAAFVKFLTIDVDLLGIFAATATSAIAWNQLSQHRNQSTAYTVTARELNIIRERIALVSDADWPQFVADSEDAISREHTMWLARHGHLRTSQ